MTIVFSDVVGSTALAERLDPESLRGIMARYFQALGEALERHGGTVEKFIGDAVMAVFGIPTIREDDAMRAVRAAAEMRRAVAALNEELETRWGVRIQARTGVNTGEVVAGDPSPGQAFVTGDAVNVAARLEQAAAADEILLGTATELLVRSAVRTEPVDPLHLKGKSQPEPAFRLIEVLRELPAISHRFKLPLVGREGELELLETLFSRAVEDRSCQLVTVLGAAGVGKSRLVDELLQRLGDRATVLGGRCLSYGQGITYWPVGEVVRQAAGISEEHSTASAKAKIAELLPDDSRRATVVNAVSGAIGLSDTPAAQDEIFWAFRKLLEALSRERPLVVVFDDLHWAAASFLDLVVDVARMTGDAALLVVCLARPELAELTPALAGDARESSLPVSLLVLEALGERDSATLIERLLRNVQLADNLRARITEGAEGNPLFIEEMVAMLIEDGVLREDEGRWRAIGDVSSITIPPSIEALLSARLDRLAEGPRGVAGRAAVIGQEFWRAAEAQLSPEDARSRLDQDLKSLVQRQFLRPAADATVTDDELYRFHHILIREAAYRALLKEARAQLHQQLADWLERRAGERLPEYQEILGYHLEQAYRYREQLAPLDEHGRALAGRAAAHVGAAGRRALARGDMSAAVNLLERATELLPRANSLRLELLHDLVRALRESGAFARALEVASNGLQAARAARDEASEARISVEQGFTQIFTDPAVRLDEVAEVAKQANVVLERACDAAGLARGLYLLGFVEAGRLRNAPAIQAIERGLDQARRARDRQTEADLLIEIGHSLVYGPAPVPEGIRRCEQMMADADGHRGLQGAMLGYLAALHARRGRFRQARELIRASRAVDAEAGRDFRVAASSRTAGEIERLAGDPVAAEKELRWGYDRLVAMGETGVLSTMAAELGDVLHLQGRFDEEVFRLTLVSEQSASKDDRLSQILWRRLRAKVLVRRGRIAAAERLARDAVQVAGTTEYLEWRADALMDLAEVLILVKRRHEASRASTEALQLYEAKANVASARQAEARLSRLATTC